MSVRDVSRFHDSSRLMAVSVSRLSTGGRASAEPAPAVPAAAAAAARPARRARPTAARRDPAQSPDGAAGRRRRRLLWLRQPRLGYHGDDTLTLAGPEPTAARLELRTTSAAGPLSSTSASAPPGAAVPRRSGPVTPEPLSNGSAPGGRTARLWFLPPPPELDRQRTCR